MSEANAQSIAPGTVVGERYRVIEPLGAGAMGTVYRVEHTLMGKAMAMKLMRPELSNIAEVVERFEREARSASRLDDEHIVRVTDFGRAADGSLFLIMELLEGEPLSKRIRERGAFPVEDAIGILDQILVALDHAHGKEVIHRDLKPDNIMVAARGGQELVKILDFGLAKITNQSVDESKPLTQAGMVFGTPRYMAPEQAAGEPADRRSDLYSAGIIFFEMLSGKAPFSGGSTVEILSAHLTKPPPPLVLSLGDEARERAIQEVVSKALAKHKEERFASASEFRAALGACLPHAQEAPFSATVRSASRVSAPPAAPKRSASKGLVLAGVVAIGLTGAAILLGYDAKSPLVKAEEALALGQLEIAETELYRAKADGDTSARVLLLEARIELSKDDVTAALKALGAAFDKDRGIVGEAAFQAAFESVLKKDADAGYELLKRIAQEGERSSVPMLERFVEQGSSPRVRRRAYQGLDRLDAASEVDGVPILIKDLQGVRSGDCELRKWYVSMLAKLEDERILPALKKEASRTGNVLDILSGSGDVNACMQKELKRAIADRE